MTDMKQTIEVTGLDAETAIQKGLEQLDVGQDRVEIEILDEGKRGVLGLGARDARVRLTRKEQAPAPPPETSHDETAQESVAQEETPRETYTQTSDAADESVDDHTEQKEAEVAQSVLVELLELMGLGNVQVKVERATPAPGEKDPPWILNVRGKDADILIGRRGETMDALQRVTRLIVGREMSSWVHLVVDVEGFKARRADSLRRLALRMADQVIETDRRAILEPMPPHERRVIHLALRDHPQVFTESVGEGKQRKVTIIPR